MITKILKQLWNEKGQNAWLFIELIIIAIFLWLAIDPLYTLNKVSSLPQGIDYENVCTVYLFEHSPSSVKYDPVAGNNEDDKKLWYKQIIKNIATMPEVETYALAFNLPMTGMEIFNHNLYYKDEETNEEKYINALLYNASTDFLGVYKIRDIHSGEIPTPLKQHEIYLSRSAATKMFGTTECIGKEFYQKYIDSPLIVKGVVEDFIPRPYRLPGLAVFSGLDNETYVMTIRLKEGVDKKEFIQRFRIDIIPTSRIGNCFIAGINDYVTMAREHTERIGETSKYRFQLFLSFFAVFCVFLGIVSTFWIRTNARRSEIGIMRSMGASRRRIIAQFITEAVLMITIAFVVAMPFIAHHIATNDFAQPISEVTNEMLTEYSSSFTTLPRFTIITLCTYAIIVATAVLAAVIPATKACNTTTAEALRE